MKRKRYPLRKVTIIAVDSPFFSELHSDELECGHWVLCDNNPFDSKHPEKKECRLCGEAKGVEV